MPNRFVHSNFPRVPGDYYPTIDPRCVYGFLEHFQPRGLVVDTCAPQGSGIVNTLQKCGYQAEGLPDAFGLLPGGVEWIVSNPPYSRELVTMVFPKFPDLHIAPPDPESIVGTRVLPLVDAIILRAIRFVEDGRAMGAAFLLRSTFDHAKSRAFLFEHPHYWGQIKLRFRPWWSDDHSKQPIHNYVWHIWMIKGLYSQGVSVVRYADGVKP